MKSLIVEDDYVSRKLLQTILSVYGSCVAVADGVEAIEAFRQAYLDQEPFSLICLDVMMPGMDGGTVLRDMRQFEESNSVVNEERAKIIMTTALNDPKTIMRSFKDQCDEYLIKPINRVKLIAMLDEMGLV